MLEIRDGWTTPLEWLVEREALVKPPRSQVFKVLLKFARSDRARLFALIDCARDDEALRLLAYEEQPWRSLFQGSALEGSIAAALVLVQVKGVSRLMQWLTEEVWARQRAIWLTSNLDLETLANHLAGFIRIEDRYGVSGLLRFYDPRVMRTYLTTCAAPELETFLAGSRRFLCESESGDVLVFDRPSYEAATLAELEPLGDAARSTYVSEATMSALERYGERLFQESTIGWLVREQGEAVAGMTFEALAALVSEAMERGRRYRIHFEEEVQRFAALMATLGPRFDADPQYATVNEVLAELELPAKERLDRIDELIAASTSGASTA